VKLGRQTETQRLALSSTIAVLAQSPAPPRFKVPPGTNSHVSHLCTMPLSEHFRFSPPRLTSVSMTVDAL
jgi:hypothetical protein